MKSLSTHEQIRLKITAFLFNRRADALRGEIYRALCLHVLNEIDEPCSHEQIVELVAYALGTNVKITDSLKTIIIDELNRLTNEGIVLLENSHYSLHEGEIDQLPDVTGQEKLNEIIFQELCKIASALNSEISRAQLDSLFNFYIEVSNVIAHYQVGFVSRGSGIQEIDSNIDEISLAVAESKDRYQADQFIDVDKFILKSLIHPNEILSSYLYRLIQVNVITQLLAWDPSLEYLKNTILTGKTIYLDSSALFILTQTSDPLHHFLVSLLQASHKDLGVRLKVHQITLKEYQQVMESANGQIGQYHSYLRQIAGTCKRDNDNPADYLESSIFVDYVSNNLDQIDLGSWQRYLNAVTGRSLSNTLDRFSIEIDQSSVYVPEEEYQNLQFAMTRASKEQMKRGKRSYAKFDTRHDAKIYYLINSIRNKRPNGEMSLGYDTYLLTLDGSLVHFTKDYGIPWTETYFVYPNQWYELTFPFLRINTSENPDFAAALASVFFSRAFPTLTSLIPLELCPYVFDLGGADLPMGSIQNVVQGLIEERLIESLDPVAGDKRKQEAAKLRVQRLIAEEELRRKETVQKLEEEAELLKSERNTLRTDVEQLATSKEDLVKEITQKESDIQKYGSVEAKIEAITSQYEQENLEQQAKYVADLNQLRSESAQEMREKEEQIAKKDRDLAEFRDRIEVMERSLKTIEEKQKEDQEEKDRQEVERIQRMLTLRKSVITALMVGGLVVTLPLLIYFQIYTWVIVVSTIFMGLALPLYHWSDRYTFVVYSFGLLMAGGQFLVQYKFDVLLWIIPMAWNIMIFGIDYSFKKRAFE